MKPTELQVLEEISSITKRINGNLAILQQVQCNLESVRDRLDELHTRIVANGVQK